MVSMKTDSNVQVAFPSLSNVAFSTVVVVVAVGDSVASTVLSVQPPRITDVTLNGPPSSGSCPVVLAGAIFFDSASSTCPSAGVSVDINGMLCDSLTMLLVRE